ncbi:MAG TPA: gliding motility-associated protein GldE [Bacteroidetes bacterium]|nr:gliding motility-associated protein GldE [Bacteroidota bacterium]
MDPDPASLSYISAFFPDFLFQYGPFFLVLILLLVLSAVASGTEVAYFSLSQAEIQDFKEEDGKVWDILHRPKRLLATILIFNNLVNVAIILISSFALHKMARQYGWEDTSIGNMLVSVTEVGLITFVLLFFGEITPKIYASQNRVRIVRMVGPIVFVFRFLLLPISLLLIRSTHFLDRRIKMQRAAASFDDIRHAIDLTSEEDSPEEEKDILKGIVNFSSTQVKSILRARVDVVAVPIHTDLQDLVALINEEGYSRMPVFEDSLDQVRGILYVKDLLPLLKTNNVSKDWQTLVRPAYFIPETKKIDDLLEEFKSRRLHIAIVVDEFGGTSGLVTLEDIIEEIFGEIVDEFDDEELVFSKLSDTEYIFDGKMPLNDLIRNVDLPDNAFDEVKGEADSLAGLILELHGKIPEMGTIILHKPYRYTVESVSKNRVKRVKFEILVESNAETSIENE